MNCPKCNSTDVIIHEGYTQVNGNSHVSTKWECNDCGSYFYAYYEFKYTETAI